MSAYPDVDKFSTDDYAIKEVRKPGPTNISIDTIKPVNLLNILFLLVRLLWYTVSVPFCLSWLIIVFVFTFKFQHELLIYWVEDNNSTKYKGESGYWYYGYYNPIKWIIRTQSFDICKFETN